MTKIIVRIMAEESLINDAIAKGLNLTELLEKAIVKEIYKVL